MSLLLLTQMPLFCRNAAVPASVSKATPAEQAKAVEEIKRFFDVSDPNRVTSVQKLVQALNVFDSSFSKTSTIVSLAAPALRDKIRSAVPKLPATLQTYLNKIQDEDMVIIINEVKAFDLLDHFVDPNTDVEAIAPWPDLVDTSWDLLENSPRYHNLGETLLGLKNSGSWTICWYLRGTLDQIPCWIKAKGKETGVCNLMPRIKT